MTTTTQFTDAQIAAAGRALADNNAKACGVDKDDNWKIYGEQFIEEARLVIAALASQPQAGAAGASDYKLVPLAPTRAMIAATVDKVFDGAIEDANVIEDIYVAMVESAPASSDNHVADTVTLGAGDVKQWHERYAELGAAPNELIAERRKGACRDAEDCVCGPKQHAEAKEVFAAIREVEALASQPQAGAAGASIDTPEFRDRLRKCSVTWDTYEWDTHATDLIAHIDAQFARQRQETEIALLEVEALKVHISSYRSYIEELEIAARQRQGEPVAPHVLEALSWNGRERDDLTLEEAVEAFRFGYKKVRQRDDRAMLAQIIHLMASAPAPQADEVKDAGDTARLDLLLRVSGFHFEIIDQQFYLLDARGRIAGKGQSKRAAIDAALRATAADNQKEGA